MVALSALALAGCGVESGKDQQETNRSTHVARGDGDKPPPRPQPTITGSPQPQPTPTITGSPWPEPPVSPPTEGCVGLGPADELNFGIIMPGEVAERDVTVTNKCEHEVILMSASIMGLSSKAFELTQESVAPTVLQPGHKHVITVRFEPINGELAEAALVVSTTRMDFIIRQTRLTLRGAGGPR